MQEDLMDTLREIEILKSTDHPNVAKLIDYYESDKYLFLVLELLTGQQLYKKLVDKESFDEMYAAEVIPVDLEAINYLHTRNISHRDIKPENFVFENKDSDVLKLIDFGLSSTFERTYTGAHLGGTKGLVRMHTTVGTYWYMAPEVLMKQYTEKCDIWSAGVILYIMLCGYPPFYGEDIQKLKQKILKGKLKFNDEVWDQISREAKDLISKMLVPEWKGSLQLKLLTTFGSNLPDFYCDDIMVHGLENAKVHPLALPQKENTPCNRLPMLEDEEIQKYRKLYLKLDENKDGLLELEQLNSLLSPYLSKQQIEKIFKAMDLDQSGKIQFSEFLASTISQAVFLQEQNLKDAFNSLDTDLKGYFTIQDLINVVENSSVDVTSEELKMLINETFPNGNTKVKYQDFKAFMEQLSE
eukprot:CAMPEP_0202959636 /NCGR_PEP_ID=MMETSP1396-20130829/3816_1 /ASSEMBLY_ACC=CAM_ASM_000872 /TAXON_ID= /ORGANISM="Pseudokeronopsis sp., Strain Brazil" /LENGTH=411 /DNA_ID=CAMNT_0049678309 /DNA_START=310 /DNA_END=1551 /DNA_ORIENTATION=-